MRQGGIGVRTVRMLVTETHNQEFAFGKDVMKTHTTPVTVDTKLGKLYMAVATASEESHQETGRGRVTEIVPSLWVATDPEFETVPAAEYWTIRGRAYGVHYHLSRKFGKWTRGTITPYGGGFRNDRQGPVEFRTKTWEAMWDAVQEGADAFARMHPRWGELSTYLLHRSNTISAEERAEAARKQAKEADTEAERHRFLEIDTRNALPSALRDLVPFTQV